MPAYSGFVSLIGAPTALLGAGDGLDLPPQRDPGAARAGRARGRSARARARPRAAGDRRSSPARPSPPRARRRPPRGPARGRRGDRRRARRGAPTRDARRRPADVAVLAKQTAVLALCPPRSRCPGRSCASSSSRSIAALARLRRRFSCLRPAGAHTGSPPARSFTRSRSGGRSASRPIADGRPPATA